LILKSVREFQSDEQSGIITRMTHKKNVKMHISRPMANETTSATECKREKRKYGTYEYRE